MGWSLLRGDAARLPLADNSIDSVVCDPPYSYAFMGSKWDSHATPQEFQAWCEVWAREALRVLRPGGHVVCFGGTRTVHRLTCGLEDAGFEIRDTLKHWRGGDAEEVAPAPAAWLYGSGFP